MDPTTTSILSIIGAISQSIQAMGVVIGIILILRQLRQLREEELERHAELKHRDWGALQWAMSLIDPIEVDKKLGLLQPTTLPVPVYRFLWGFGLMARAIQDGFLRQDLIAIIWAHQLSWLHLKFQEFGRMERVKMHPTIAAILDSPDWKPLRDLAGSINVNYPNPPDFTRPRILR